MSHTSTSNFGGSMRMSRVVTGLVSAALLGLPVLVASPAHAAEINTRLVMKVGPKNVQVTRTVRVVGGVEAFDPSSQTWRRTPVGSVTLDRRLAGSKRWSTLQKDTTADEYDFSTKAVSNATYRVRYSGGNLDGNTFPARSQTRAVKVRRNLNDSIVSRRLTLKGRVSGLYKRKTVVIERKTCLKGCTWKRYTSLRTTRQSRWSTRLPAPSRGTWYWRAYTPATVTFVKSLSNYEYRTYRR